MARPYPLPDRQQKRGCATVPVPREDVLVDGRVPKGCRFHPDKGNGTVLCTPTVAQKVGVLDVERKKPVPKPGEMSKRKYCYTAESPHPYRKDGELKQGCEVDEETGLTVQLFQPEALIDFGDDEAIELHRPVHLLLENINPFHQHIDFIYYAQTDSFQLNPGAGEANSFRWFSQEELANNNLPMPGNVKALAAEALMILGM